MEEKLRILNNFWNKQSDIKLLTPFIFEDEFFKGSIQLDASPKDSLDFEVKIPLSYPFSVGNISVWFICKSIKGARHLNPDGSLCIHTPKNDSFENRLVEEASLLKQWRDKFYIQDSSDERYEYLNIYAADNSKFLFTDFEHNLIKGDWGYFNAYQLADYSKQFQLESKVYYIQNIGNYSCQWSTIILDTKKRNVNGLFFFIGEEPLAKGRWNATDWEELDSYLSYSNKEKLYELKNLKEQLEIHILLGYYIPNTSEIHWQILKINNKDIPVKSNKVIRNYYEYKILKRHISWSQTVNASYNRYFGRGSLNFELANKKILIIGVGAIGSSLAKILTRTGCLNISLCDNDVVESGNICRADFFVEEISLPKIIAIGKQLKDISPFVNIGFEKPTDKILDEPYISKTKTCFNQYDIIFDCTSDMELALILDKIRLDSNVINISISNGAKHLICVTGGHNVSIEKSVLFQTIDQGEELLVYEGTGCWSPTFTASYFDINSLLNLAVKNLNKQFINNNRFNSFAIHAEDNDSTFNLKTIDY